MRPRLVALMMVALGACTPDSEQTDTTGTSTTSSPTTGGTSTPTTGGSTVDSTSETTGEPTGEPFTVVALDKQWITGTGGWDTQHRDVDIDLGPGTFKSVKLIVDLETSCFPFENWVTPPEGHNWPAKCDAFDRTMGFIVDPAATPDDPPGFEALRSITPFGGPAHLEQDITDWANAHPGAHSLRAYINTWPDGAGQVSGSEGGWTLSVELEVVPGPMPRQVLAAIPLYAQDFTAEMSPPVIDFSLPEGTTSAALAYLVSGHGGANDPSSACIGPAEEFCRRNHHILIDGEELSAFAAWRSDCTDFCTIAEHTWPDDSKFSYCTENPCGSIQSVNAPRANWCPGDVVKPFAGPLPLVAGAHSFGFVIDDVFAGGSWTTSAIVYAYAD